MTYTTWLVIIATIGIVLAFLVPLLRKSRISNVQNIDYITQLAIYMSAFVMLLPKDRSASTFLITLIILLCIPLLAGVQYLIARWRIKRNIGLKAMVTDDERTANIYLKSARNALFANNFVLILVFLIQNTINRDSFIYIAQVSTLVFWASYIFYYYRKV